MSVCVCSHLQVLLWLLWYTPHTRLSELLNSSCILCKSRFISRVYLYLSFADSHLWEKHTTKVENTRMPWSCIIWTGWSKKLRIWSTKRVRTLHFLLKLLIAPKSGAWSSIATFSTRIHFRFFDSAKFTHLIMHYLAWLLSFPASSVRTLKQLSTKRSKHSSLLAIKEVLLSYSREVFQWGSTLLSIAAAFKMGQPRPGMLPPPMMPPPGMMPPPMAMPPPGKE